MDRSNFKEGLAVEKVSGIPVGTMQTCLMPDFLEVIGVNRTIAQNPAVIHDCLSKLNGLIDEEDLRDVIVGRKQSTSEDISTIIQILRESENIIVDSETGNLRITPKSDRDHEVYSYSEMDGNITAQIYRSVNGEIVHDEKITFNEKGVAIRGIANKGIHTEHGGRTTVERIEGNPFMVCYTNTSTGRKEYRLIDYRPEDVFAEASSQQFGNLIDAQMWYNTNENRSVILRNIVEWFNSYPMVNNSIVVSPDRNYEKAVRDGIISMSSDEQLKEILNRGQLSH